MSKSIAITGTTGRLGCALQRHFESAGWSTVGLNRSLLDLNEPNRIAEVLEKFHFDALIHPAAITSLESCEADPEQARRVNATAPSLIAAHCAALSLPMIHVSTDYVFDGKTSKLRTETDPAHPINVYGDSKRAGEKSVIAAHPSAWVARVSWLFGPDKAGFVEAILDRAQSGEPVQAIEDKYSVPSYTEDVCRAFEGLLGLSRQEGGVIHVCNRGQTDWHSYAEEIFRYTGRTSQVVERLALRDMDVFIAERPIHTAMDPGRLEGLLGRPMRRWQDALAHYLSSTM